MQQTQGMYQVWQIVTISQDPIESKVAPASQDREALKLVALALNVATEGRYRYVVRIAEDLV